MPNDNADETTTAVRLAELTLKLEANTHAVEELTRTLRGDSSTIGLLTEHALIKEAIAFGRNPSLAQRVSDLEKYARVITWSMAIIATSALIAAVSYIGTIIAHVGVP